MAQTETIVYTDGGETYKGRLPNRSLDEWKQYGKDANQTCLYKGRRYWSESQQVVVFNTKRWDAAEIKRRKGNGFSGIREYLIF